MTDPVCNAFLTFPAELSSLHSMLAWVCDHVDDRVFNHAEIRRIEIALEEALINIIQYAYQEKKGVIEITYNYYLYKYIEIIIRDFGIPFNPLKNVKKIDKTASIEERNIGGLGISFIKELMDQVEYFRDENANVLILKKQCKN